jgi:RimJ/RimL family protein N-acetyltransferase
LGQECIGIVELGPRVREIPSYELGFWVRSDLTGQGYATEACSAVLDYAFTKLKANRVFMRCEPENMPSRRVAEKIGLKQEAWLKNDALGVDGKTVVDTMVFGQTATGWAARS